MSTEWGVPTVEEEAELHRTRLLNVEERPFKRIVKRLGAIQILIQERARNPLTPPPEDNGANGEATSVHKSKGTRRREELVFMKEDINMDFSAFDNSIARIQLLLDANEQERERYAADKIRIIKESQAVRDSTAELRVQLEYAKATLAQRRKFDDLADRITNSKMLRPRDEQHVNLRKLEEECEELERESGSYTTTLRARCDQFDKIIAEGEHLRAQIRDEKDDFDRREGMEEGEEEGETASQAGGSGPAEGQTPRHISSQGNASPNPELVAAVHNSQSRGDISRPESSHRALSPAGHDRPENVRPFPSRLGEISQSASCTTSREPSPGKADEGEIEEGEDVEMEEVGSNGNSQPRITVESPGGNMDTT